ncbi:phosphoenolpyruvate--protein phosphotransferase [Mastigocladopsis repens]|uniref:phosphoenolpyruvate--protein phosphotransferase n=1 Tax=Mastigocladopsis repens TaxID=221287 RepID=UPI0003069FA4|nr:phosphoenolpyruvate--protein phosphotransferase [Mastigocladopsis repens]
MVGIVIVSHSKQLAEGVRELAAQMVQGKVPLAVAAGIDDPENPLGTDAMQVYEAIASIYTDEGVIILMDLGSALMSAEMALEFLSQEHRDKVHLCEAPLVEGAIAAAVAAASGSNIQQVMAEARGALLAKATQLGVDMSHIQQETAHVSTSFVIEGQRTNDTGHVTKEIRLLVRNRLGLHARPAAKFVATAARFQSQIKVKNVTKNIEAVRADSINQVATLGVRQGHELVITATGSDADEALAALQALVESHFGEEETTLLPHYPTTSSLQHPISTSSHHFLQGIPASSGVAIAPVFLYCPTPIDIQQYHVDKIEEEWQGLQVAIQIAQEEIQALLSQASIQIGDAEAAIFDAHLLFLEDPVVLEAVHQRIFEQHLNAEAAWQAVVDELANHYRSIEDSYLQERVADVVDVGQRVLRLLTGFQSHIRISDHSPTHLHLCDPAILIATDLSPSDTARLDPTKVLGICTTSGSAICHSAIIARRLGIPVIVGLPTEILQVADNTLVALDGESGRVWIEPEPEIQTALEAKREAQQVAHQQALTTASSPAMTRDQKQISVFANIGGLSDTEEALILGAEGVGLFRTEFLYLERTTPPSEEEQLVVYQSIAQLLDHRPLIIRTLDVGGDKPIPYLNFPHETNPFLGWRGIRFCLDNPDIFKTQLRAILKASPGHQIKIMFPMIATVQEIQAAKAMLAEVQAELRQAGIPFDENMEVGIMVEIPSAVVLAEQLAAEVDFFSLGTNDLSQYIMAADRTHPRVATLVDAMHPAVLRMIQQTVQAAHKAGIWVGLCGELAADPLAATILLGLGLDEVSLNPQAIPEFKQAIAQLTMAEAEIIAASAMQQNSAAEVRELVRKL